MTEMDVCLLLEGTYPFVTGGVSSWVHTLVTELKHLRFGVVHISPREGYFPHGYSYKLPENLVSVREVYLHHYKLPKKASRESIREQIQLFRGFIQDLQDGNTQAFQEFYAAVNQDLGGGLNAASIFQTKESWDVLVESYSQEAAEESFINYFWTWRYALFPLFNILAAQLPDAHLYHTISTGYAGMLAAGATLKKGRPMVLTEHGIYAKERRIEIHRADWIQDWSSGEIVAERKPPFFKRFWTRQFAMMSKVTYAHASEIYTLYEGNRRTQIGDGAEKDKTNVIPNGIDLVRYGEAAKQFDARAENERFTLAFVGRVSPIKDVKTLLRAIRLVANEVPNLRARILGPMDEDPKYADACKKLFNRLHLDGIAAFEGKVNVLEELPKVDLLVLTSISEAQPLVILEAGAVGVPTVTTDVGSCSELLNGSTPEDRALGSGGLLTPIASPGETAKAILQLIRDRDLLKRMGRAMRQRVHRFYALQDMIAAYGDIYGKFQPGGRCFGGAPDAEKSAEKKGPVGAEAASPAAAPLAVHPPAVAAAGANLPEAPAAAAAPSAATPVAKDSIAELLSPLAPEPAPVFSTSIEEELVPLFVEPSSPAVVVAPASAAIPLAAPIAPPAPVAPIALAAPVVPVAPVEAVEPVMRVASDLARATESEPAKASAPAPEPASSPAPTAELRSTSAFGELRALLRCLEAWDLISGEILAAMAESVPAERDADAAGAALDADADADAASDSNDASDGNDEIDLGEEDLPADLPLSCEALAIGEVAPRALRRSDADLGLELIDDLMRELAADVQGLRVALAREGDEIAELEQDLICLDETQRLEGEPGAPAPLGGAKAWWGEAHAEEPIAADESAAPHAFHRADPIDAELDSATGETETHVDPHAEVEEEWLELDEEELPRDMPLTCDVLGDDEDDDDDADDDNGGGGGEEEEEHDDDAFERADADAGELGLASEDGNAQDLAESEEEPTLEPAADEPPAMPSSSEPSYAGEDAHEPESEPETEAVTETPSDEAEEADEDEIELGEEDLPADLPLSCEALAEGDVATKARTRRSQEELGLDVVDDLMRELVADIARLSAALTREGQEIAETEQDLICLDESERGAEPQVGPSPSGAEVAWGATSSADSADAANDEPLPFARTSEPADENELAENDAAAPSLEGEDVDEVETWLELDEEELPRDMPLTCDVLGDDDDNDDDDDDNDDDGGGGGGGGGEEEHDETVFERADADAGERVFASEDGNAQDLAEPEAEPIEDPAADEPPAMPSSSAPACAGEDAHEPETETVTETPGDEAEQADEDEIELGEEDLPADLPLSCEALAEGDVATKARARRSEEELGLDVVDDLMRELVADIARLSAALTREGQEIAETEQDLICLDESERGAEPQLGPSPSGAAVAWGTASSADSGDAANDEPLPFARTSEPADTSELAENDTAAPSLEDEDEDEDETWLELDEEELPRDMPLTCAVLGDDKDNDDEDDDDENDGVEDRTTSDEDAAMSPAPDESALDAALAEAELIPEATAPAGEDAREPETETAAETARGEAGEDEIELGEEDLPADLPLSCEALAEGDVSTKARARRSEEELGLDLVDDLMRELVADLARFTAALAREGEEIAEKEQELICLDESMSDPEAPAVPPRTGAEVRWGSRTSTGGAADEEETETGIRFAPAEEDGATAASELDPATTSRAEDGEEENEAEAWLELEAEELPRDMPLRCDVLGDDEGEDALECEELDACEAVEAGESAIDSRSDAPAAAKAAEAPEAPEAPEAAETVRAPRPSAASESPETGLDGKLGSDEFELGEEDLPADLPLSCEALVDGAVETRATRRRDEDLDLELIDDLMRELAADVHGLRAALEAEGREITEVEQELICLDESMRFAVDPADAPAPSAHAGLIDLAGDAGAGELQFRPRPASEDSAAAPVDEVITELDPPEDETADEEEWLELEEEDLPRDMPLTCSAFGDAASSVDVEVEEPQGEEEDPA